MIHSLPGVLRYATMIIIAAILLLPIIWVLSASIRPQAETFSSLKGLSIFTFVPRTITFENFIYVFSKTDYPRAVLNSFFIATTTAVLGVFVNSAAGFAFAAFDFPGKRLLFMLVLATFMIGFESIVIPLYTLILKLGWTDTYRALILPGIANGFIIFLFRQFWEGFPTEIYDAARVDGASWWRIYSRIAIPVAWPIFITGGLMLFLFQWDAFFWPLVAASHPDYTVIQVAVTRHIAAEEVQWGQLFAAKSFAMIVPMGLFLCVQRHYFQSIVSSGMK